MEGIVLKTLQLFGIVAADLSQEGAAFDESEMMQIEALPLQPTDNDTLLAVQPKTE